MVQENVLDKIDSDQLAIQVVWTPVLASDDRESVDKARLLFTDKRVTHFWDDDQSLGKSYGKVIELPAGRTLAWDIYFAFDKESEWKDDLPEPDEWAHQLGRDDRALRDGTKLRESIEKLLDEED